MKTLKKVIFHSKGLFSLFLILLLSLSVCNETFAAKAASTSFNLSHLGCPIIGDRKYGTMEDPSSGFHGLQLFACRLTLKHPRTHKQLEFLLPETYYSVNF